MSEEEAEEFMQRELEDAVRAIMPLFDMDDLAEMPRFRFADTSCLEEQAWLPDEFRSGSSQLIYHSDRVDSESNTIFINRKRIIYRMGYLIGEYLHVSSNPALQKEFRRACTIDPSKTGSEGAIEHAGVFSNLFTFVQHYCGLYYDEKIQSQPKKSEKSVETRKAEKKETKGIHMENAKFDYNGMLAAEYFKKHLIEDDFRQATKMMLKEAADYIKDLTGIDIAE